MSGGVLGVVLAGGHGRRMGGAGKPLLMLAGTPMICRVAAALEQMTGSVVVAAGEETARYTGLEISTLPDPQIALTDADQGRAGPLAAILAGLEDGARRQVAWILTCPADVPLVPSDLFAQMADYLLQNRKDDGGLPAGVTVEAVSADGDMRWHPAIALLQVSLAPALRQALNDGERRVGGWMRQAGVLKMQWPSPDGPRIDPFSNINTPEDLERAETALASAVVAGGRDL